jgi:hypothetical protein
MAGEAMISDLISYAVLASVFVVTGLRMFIEKPNKIKEARLPRHNKSVTD